MKIDDWLGKPRRSGRPPKLSDAELLTLAVAQALLGIRSEARWLRFLPQHLPGAFPYLPGQSDYNKRMRAALPLFKKAIRLIATDTDLWFDDVWVTDSTPVECGRSRPTVKRSDLAGWASYGYCSSHSRFFWGLRLHLICTPSGLPIAWSLATAKTDDRHVLTAALEDDPDLLATRPGQLIIADKGYVSAERDRWLTERGARLLRPSYRNRTPHSREHLLKPVRQLIESVNDTLKGQLDLELHGGRSIEGVGVRIAQRLLAMTAAIWHNRTTGQPLTRSLIASVERSGCEKWCRWCYIEVPRGWSPQDADVLIVPDGNRHDLPGSGMQRLLADKAFIRRLSGVKAIMVGVCTVVMALSAAGFTRGRPATTHSGSKAALAAQGAKVINARVVDDGNLVRCGGITSGLDAAVWLVERFCGAQVANQVETVMEYERRGTVWRNS